MTNRMDHTNCTHPRTPAGRRACRAGRTSEPTYVLTGRTIDFDNMVIGSLVETTFNDDCTGEWREYREVVSITYIHADVVDGKYRPIEYVVVHTNHPTAKVGRTVYAGETRAWDEFLECAGR